LFRCMTIRNNVLACRLDKVFEAFGAQSAYTRFQRSHLSSTSGGRRPARPILQSHDATVRLFRDQLDLRERVCVVETVNKESEKLRGATL
jgi:hypothetical protein